MDISLAEIPAGTKRTTVVGMHLAVVRNMPEHLAVRLLGSGAVACIIQQAGIEEAAVIVARRNIQSLLQTAAGFLSWTSAKEATAWTGRISTRIIPICSF